MGQREEHAVHCPACARDEGSACPYDQAEVLNKCHPAIFWIHAFFSQESIIHEQPVEKEIDSSGFVIYQGNHPKRNPQAQICLLTEGGSSIKLSLTEDGREATHEL